MRVDVAVLGAGPAGAAAAVAASSCGLSVAVVDEQPRAGGQVYRAPPPEWPDTDGPEAREGAALRAALAASGAVHLAGRRLWSVLPEAPGFRLSLAGDAGVEELAADRLVVAAGTTERVVPFPGWTLPGVIGLAAATVLLKAQKVRPGDRVLVAGRGPLLYAVAAGIVAGGGTVVAVADGAGRADWLAAAPAMAARPDLLRRGVLWRLALARAGVPLLHRHAVVEAQGTEAVSAATVAPVARDGALLSGPQRHFSVDAVCVGDGLVPAVEAPRLLRAPHRFDRALGGWVPEADRDGRTGLAGLYVAGDGAGVRGAAAAALHGRLAGYAAAADAAATVTAPGAAPGAADVAALRRAHARAARFGGAMAGLAALRPARVASIPAAAVVCRCEDVTRAEIDAALDAGAREVNQLKHFTRCGMGPCQGRMCGEAAAELVAARVGGRARAGAWTARPPLRPVPLDTLIGEFTYADIPIPPPAPQ